MFKCWFILVDLYLFGILLLLAVGQKAFLIKFSCTRFFRPFLNISPSTLTRADKMQQLMIVGCDKAFWQNDSAYLPSYMGSNESPSTLRTCKYQAQLFQ
jgi:hypothetical protein